MTEEERWEKVRLIVREECERISQQILEVIEKHKKRPPLKIVNGQLTGITPELKQSWGYAYGAVDMDSEIRRAVAWILSNPQAAPKNIERFLNNWFTKCQDRAALKAIPTSRAEVATIKRRACAYCSDDSIGSVSGINHCRAHYQDAYEERPRRMLGVVAKPVAGAD